MGPGLECAPDYAPVAKPGRYPSVLRNLHLLAIVLNTSTALLALALLPMSTILDGDNVLSAAAEVAGGRGLRIVVVIDAIVVLCAGSASLRLVI